MITYGATDVGSVRSVNQDFIFTSDLPVGNLPNLYIVADGMGGHQAGDLASRYAVSVFSEAAELSPIKDTKKILEAGILETNSKVFLKSESNEAYYGMGTTMVISTIVNNKLFVANIGDSRLYICKDHSIKQITEDHSLVAEMLRRGQINQDEAKYHPDKNIITRAIGTVFSISADYFEVDLDGDEIILMCSDGLTNMVDEDSILGILSSDMTVKEKTKELIDQANQNGGMDNIAVIIIDTKTDEVDK